MTGNEYQQAALRTANGGNCVDVVNGVLGLAGESGECADIVKKHKFQGHPLDTKKLAKELGDVAWYLAVTAHAIGYSLDEIFVMNVDKLWKRYPDGFSKERSINREEE